MSRLVLNRDGEAARLFKLMRDEAREASRQTKPWWFTRFLDESRPWRSRTLYPLKGEEVTFAIRTNNGEVVSCEDGPALESTLRSRSDWRELEVAIPAYPRWIPAVLLMEPTENTLQLRRPNIITPLLITVIVGYFYFKPAMPALGRGEARMMLLLLMMMFGIMPLCEALFSAWDRRRHQTLERRKQLFVNEVFFKRWLGRMPVLTIKAAATVLVILYGMQAIYGGWVTVNASNAITQLMGSGNVYASISKAALVKKQVWAGEWWRLLTGGLMHGHLLHLFFNVSAFYMLGRMVSAFMTAPLLGLIFLLSITGGAIASLFLTGGLAAVGSSGGVMGLLGFLTVMAVVRKVGLPASYRSLFLQFTLIMIIFGALGAAFIDNAGHAGGFLIGGLLAMVIVPRAPKGWDYKPPTWLIYAGWASWGVLVLAGLQVARVLLA